MTSDTSSPEEFRVRIYYEDTDAGGVVYHSNYLKFYERARSDWLYRHGVRQSEMVASIGVGFVVSAARLRYIRPCVLDQELSVYSKVATWGGSRIVFLQTISDANDASRRVLNEAEIEIAAFDLKTKRATNIPALILPLLPTQT